MCLGPVRDNLHINCKGFWLLRFLPPFPGIWGFKFYFLYRRHYVCFLLWQKQVLGEASFLELEMLGIWEASVLGPDVP